jgi:hypothetical protein
MSRYFSVEFNDLSFEKKEELIEEVKQSLLEEWEELGKQAMNQEWHVKPKTWQEAYCRDADVDWKMWNDLDEKSEEFQNYDWKYTIEEHAEEEADDRLWKGFHHLEVEVEI